MKELTNTELKRIEYEMLKALAVYCDLNSIRYFLACGTALGAVRHSGFIPWDDDVDVAMPRPDYEKFVSSYKSQNQEVLDSRFDVDYPYAFAKLSDKSTVLIENIEDPFPMGVYIDVFPIDGLPEGEIERKKHLKRIEWSMRLLSWKRISKSKKVKVINKIYQIIAKILLLPFSRKALVNHLDKEVRKYSYGESSFTGHLVTKAVWGNDVKPRRIFDDRVKCKFETEEFWIPADYDTYLKLEYGDYEQLPPKEKQITKHDFVAYWKE